MAVPASNHQDQTIQKVAFERMLDGMLIFREEHSPDFKTAR